MSDKSWRDYRLTEVIEAQLFLLECVAAAMEANGVLSRANFALGVRRILEGHDSLPEGTKGVVQEIVRNLELAGREAREARDGMKEKKPAKPNWTPRVLAGGRSDKDPGRAPRRLDGKRPGWTPSVIEGGKTDGA